MMKLRPFLLAILLIFTAEIVCIVLFLEKTPDTKQDVVAVNAVVQSASLRWPDFENAGMPRNLEYTIIDNEGTVLYRTREGLSETINEAIAHRDTICDIISGGSSVGKIIIDNENAALLIQERKTAAAIFIISLVLQVILFYLYVWYLKRSVIRPFSRLRDFAARVAGGNLDLPLEMDRHNVFGAFTESFDIMRDELKKAREAEAAANESKKELVAKLSHDLKTPVASIKAAAEVGSVSAGTEKERDTFGQIENKADQINTLVSNLFSATLEELQQLSVTPKDYASTELVELLKRADYLGKASIPQAPQCLLSFDKLRLQQVFDNIISNSYKYADTQITVTYALRGNSLSVRIEDYGGGVNPDELPLLLEKFRRGANADAKEGAGLGLYISRYLVGAMRGSLTIENTEDGFAVTVSIPMSGRTYI